MQRSLVGQGFLIIEASSLHWHPTFDRTPMEEWSARHRDLYLKKARHSEDTALSPVGLEPAIPPSERPQTKALERAATGIGYAMRAGTQCTNNSHNFLWAPYKGQGEAEWLEKMVAKRCKKVIKVELQLSRGQPEPFTPQQLFLLYAFKQHKYSLAI